MGRVAIVDGASFVLPYDLQLVRGLIGGGQPVDFYGSLTRYNAELLDVLRGTTGVEVHAAAVSGTVAPRWRGVLAYAGLLLALWRRRRRYGVVNLQFSVLWPLELPFGWALRRQLVFTVHNAVPHGFRGTQHRPTRWIASLARALVFASEATRDDFLRRYGERFRTKAHVLPHGLLPVRPGDAPVPYAIPAHPQALVFWSTVKPYKGVELFGELARSVAIRERGLGLEVHGAWADELHPLRDELAGLGVAIDDRYLGTDDLLALLARDVIFLMPYHGASQSGALYTLLHAGRPFICADVGDLGAFMRRHGLQGLLLRERSAAAVAECLTYLNANREALTQAFAAAQRAHDWRALLDQHGAVYRAS